MELDCSAELLAKAVASFVNLWRPVCALKILK